MLVIVKYFYRFFGCPIASFTPQSSIKSHKQAISIKNLEKIQEDFSLALGLLYDL